MSTHTLHSANALRSPEEALLASVISSDVACDLKSVQITISDDNYLSLHIMLRLPGERRWRMVSTPQLQPKQAIFLAHAITSHHATHFPQRSDIMERWDKMIDDPKVIYNGISCVMGMT